MFPQFTLFAARSRSTLRFRAQMIASESVLSTEAAALARRLSIPFIVPLRAASEPRSPVPHRRRARRETYQTAAAGGAKATSSSYRQHIARAEFWLW